MEKLFTYFSTADWQDKTESLGTDACPVLVFMVHKFEHPPYLSAFLKLPWKQRSFPLNIRFIDVFIPNPVISYQYSISW